MKRLLLLFTLSLCFLLCSCGALVDTNTTKSSELSQKYNFYSNSVSSIRGACKVSPEEADEIFLVLVDKCGADKEITVTSYVNAPYSVKFGLKNLSMTLDAGVVSSVLDGEKQIYPVEETAASESTETTSDNIPEIPHRSGDEIVGVSDKDISDLNRKIVVMNVPNDVTENWRYITLSEDIDILEYALSYYKSFFNNDSEIHAVVNFSNNTTSKISVSGGTLEVSVHDYVENEEHDAKVMYSGTLLSRYIIYTDNGDIEKLE